MADKTTPPSPAAKTRTASDKSSSNAATRDRSPLSKEELDKVTAGINPQPLPPRHDD